jgi:hypothetical protein
MVDVAFAGSHGRNAKQIEPCDRLFDSSLDRMSERVPYRANRFQLLHPAGHAVPASQFLFDCRVERRHPLMVLHAL